MLAHSVDTTLNLLRKELEIKRDEILEQLHYATLEEIFINERIYKDRGFENAASTDAACEHIDNRLTEPDLVYRDNEVSDAPYPGLKKYIKVRLTREKHLGSNPNINESGYEIS